MGSIFDALRTLVEKEDEKMLAEINSGLAPSCPINPQPSIIAQKTFEDFDGDCAGAIKMVLSGVQENSGCNGMYKKTVIHAITIKPINKKVNRSWLRRKPREFLCTPARSSRRKGFGTSGHAGREITCTQCKSLLSRYGLSLCTDKALNKLIDSY